MWAVVSVSGGLVVGVIFIRFHVVVVSSSSIVAPTSCLVAPKIIRFIAEQVDVFAGERPVSLLSASIATSDSLSALRQTVSIAAILATSSTPSICATTLVATATSSTVAAAATSSTVAAAAAAAKAQSTIASSSPTIGRLVVHVAAVVLMVALVTVGMMVSKSAVIELFNGRTSQAKGDFGFGLSRDTVSRHRLDWFHVNGGRLLWLVQMAHECCCVVETGKERLSQVGANRL